MSPDTPAVEPPPPASPADPPPAAAAPRVARTVAVTLLVLTLLGAPLGLLWATLAPATPVVKTPDGAVYGQPQPEQPVAADGWFSLLGLGFGVLAALAVWFVLSRRRGPVGLVTVVAGAFAASVVAWQVGRRIGLGAFERTLATAPDGTAFTKPADLRAGGIELLFGVLPVPYGNLLLPAFGAAAAYTLLAGWSPWPSLRPEPEPDAPWLGPPPGTAVFPDGADQSDGGRPGTAWPGPVSSGPAAPWPAPSAAPEPPAPGATEPPRG
ncbi:DUF2567 domain-containing protein [Micromonospora endophytica]|uniref:DUF2567 domain-containing protein n=1 Tax=Micromonospora endophytica TaxID=515350 RepID=A0A2W2CI23_9ACTN|nr:DUF2567 domain-containing protein [Micromonospora endophytica]PZF97550.1 DUF2567 domain-containing protein [Micromonospora endophytica]RIW48601.1 DUF2567 domain-containing protein [Micromonospora endophytica]